MKQNLAAALAEITLPCLTLPELQFKPQRLGNFWQERATLVVFFRHYG